MVVRKRSQRFVRAQEGAWRSTHPALTRRPHPTPVQPRPGPERRRRWAVLVPVIAALAGLLFTTTAEPRPVPGCATTADPSSPGSSRSARPRSPAETARPPNCSARSTRITAAEAGSDGRIAEQQRRADEVRGPRPA